MDPHCTLTIQKPDTWIPDSSENRTKCMSAFQMLLSGPVFKWTTSLDRFIYKEKNVYVSLDHLKTGPRSTIRKPDMSGIRMVTVFFLHVVFLIYFLISTVGQATMETSVRFPPKESCLDQGLTRFSKQRVKQGNWKWQLLLRRLARTSSVDSAPFRTHCPSIWSTMPQLHQTR